MTALPSPDGTPPGRRFETIDYSIDGSTAWITLSRPSRRNALSSKMYGEIRDAVRLAEVTSDVDALVLTGTEGYFAVGGDLQEGEEILASEDPLAIFAFEDKIPFYAIANCSKITVSAINGACVAGGLVIAMCADFVIAAESARLGITEGRYGMSEPWSPRLLYGRISLTDLKYLVLTGETVSAEAAAAMRMVNTVVPDEELFSEVERFLTSARRVTPSARRAYKGFLQEFNDIAPPIAASQAILRAQGGEGFGAFRSS